MAKEPKKGALTQVPKRFLQLSVKYGEDMAEEDELYNKSLLDETEEPEKIFYDFIKNNKEVFWEMYNGEKGANKDPAYIAMFDMALPAELKGKTKTIEIIHLSGTSHKKEEGLELLDNLERKKDNGILKLKRDFNNEYDPYAIEVHTSKNKMVGFVPMKRTATVEGDQYPQNYIVAANMEKDFLVAAQVVEINIMSKQTPTIAIVLGWSQ